MGTVTEGSSRRQCIKEFSSSDPARKECIRIVKDCAAVEKAGANKFVFESDGDAVKTKTSLRACMKYAPDAAKAGYTLQGAKARPKRKAEPSKRRVRKKQDDDADETRATRPSRRKRTKGHRKAETGLLRGAELKAMIQKGSGNQGQFYALFRANDKTSIVVQFDMEDVEEGSVELKGSAFRYEGGDDLAELGTLSKADRREAKKIITTYIQSNAVDVAQDLTQIMRNLMNVISGKPNDSSVEFSVRCSARDDFQSVEESAETYLDPKRCSHMEMRIESDDFAVIEDLRLGWRIAEKGKHVELLDALGIENDPKRCDSTMRVAGVDTIGIDNYKISAKTSDDDEEGVAPARRKRSKRKRKRSSGSSSETKTFAQNGHEYKMEKRNGVTRLWIDGERIKKSDPRYKKTLKRIKEDAERIEENLGQVREEFDGAMEQMKDAAKRLERRSKDLWDDE